MIFLCSSCVFTEIYISNYYKSMQFLGNTFSHRPRGKMLIPARPIPPPMVPMGPVIIPAPSTLTKNKKKQRQPPMEEPIYMPSNRALSPVASYQPVNFPHEAYLMQQYATMESQGKIVCVSQNVVSFDNVTISYVGNSIFFC